MNWFEAWEYCRSIGLHLASIESKYEQTFVEIFLPRLELPTTEAYWTSGTDLGKEGQFTWMATGRSFTFSFFRPGEPNNRFGSEDCIEMVVTPGVTSYSWNDRNCFAKAYVLCQQDVRYPDKLFGVSSS
ncbi:unnamed protein product [Orchesella dallaii]|uniref:C-type lectin domain-containing protein n=1 Tax=Orchesella dallaii TaxID=48710 RepID=A0ABP1S2G9_9HEXA